MRPFPSFTLSALIAPNAAAADRDVITTTLAQYPPHIIDLCADAQVRIRALDAGELYRDASPALVRLGIDVDRWPAPPAGLFVVEERTLYLRSIDPMTIAHEFGHAIDCALGGGVYLSGYDPELRRIFANARAFVTPYAATGLDEFFAEACRAYIGANHPGSAWPTVSRERLARTTPELVPILDRLLEGRAA